MKIALINGSPKGKRSTSASLLEDLQGCIGEKAETVWVELNREAAPEEAIQALKQADVWVFAFPLYVDGVPGHLLACLVQLGAALPGDGEKPVYGIVNCGFYEGIQTEPALWIMENWCEKAGYVWGGGIGVGGGGGLAMMPKMEPGKGPRAPIDMALSELADRLLRREARENSYVSVAFPRFLYKLAAQSGWRKAIRANGGSTKDLGKRPE